MFIFFIVGTGLFLHSGFDFPYLQWVGRLPGDVVVRKEGIFLFFPLTTSFLLSAMIAGLFRAVQRK